MSQYIKSHSNYVLKSKHQSITDGTIWERDITTIGGLNTFTPHQTPTYRSNNFIITVRDDGGVSKQHNTKKWVDNGSNSEVWTVKSISSTTTSTDFEDDTEIVLKQDYYDFSDFAYYGSLSELFRASITDAINRFPGELYCTSGNVYYTSGETIDGEWIEDKIPLGGKTYKYIVNPFGINMYAASKPSDADPLKYFTDDGYSNYAIYQGEAETGATITGWTSTYYYSTPYSARTDDGKEQYTRWSGVTSGTTTTPIYGTTTSAATPTTKYYPCIGNKVADITLNTEGSGNYEVSAWLGDDNIVYYLTTSDYTKVHIRPTEAIQKKFYKECDNFQKLILNKDTSPKYKAIFSVIHENQFGYYRELEEFIFPTSEGGYNIDASSYGFNEYTTRLSQIGEFYDEYFTDNLYRSMTHEAVKNFDWTYTREFNEGDEEEYVIGGEKMQKALRVFAREFDEVLAYINSIKSSSRISYDERSNIPDYFLTDIVEDDGWNVVLPIPYDLSEYYISGGSKQNITDSAYVESGDCVGQLFNLIEVDGKNYPIIRNFSQSPISAVTPYSSSLLKDGTSNGYFVQCCSADTIINTDVPYYAKKECKDENENNKYCYYVVPTDENHLYTKYDDCADVIRNRIKSYTDEKKYTYQDVSNEFLRRLKINSRHILRHKGTIDGIEMMLGLFGLKSKRYNDSMSGDTSGNTFPTWSSSGYDYEVTEYVAKSNTITDEWDSVHQMHKIDWFNSTKTITYDYRSMSNYNRDSIHVDYYPYQGLMVSYDGDEANSGGTRTLYPSFNKGEQYDGNPYFQMNGGWLSKKVIGSGGTYNFQFDVDNNIVSSDTDVFKETVRNIRRFNTLQDMLSVPSNELYNGQVVYVSNIDKNTAVLDGKVYELQTDSYGSYIELVKESGIIKASDDLFFDEYVTVYNRSKQEQSYFLDDIPNGHIIKAYIVFPSELMRQKCSGESFVCYDEIQGVSTFKLMCRETNDVYSNYFVINDISNSNKLSKDNTSGDTSGWIRLTNTTECGDNKVSVGKINTIINDNKGNNPHNGNLIYDNGEEYHNYYRQLFKYAYENDLFDERCYENFEESASSAYSASVFSAASFTINSGFKDDLIDRKIVSGLTSADTKSTITNQTLNTKLIQIRFKLHYENPFSHDGQCELKYLDDIVMNYLTQMIPSTAILQIKYDKKS